MTIAPAWPGLPILVRLADAPVVLIGTGEAAAAKRRLLERAGARVTADAPDARLAVVALDDEAEARAAVARLRARGLLVNAVDRPELCDFTLPAVVDRAPVLVAVATGGVSAGLAAALRQRLEAILPAGIGTLATALLAARPRLREAFPDAAVRRRALAAALAPGGDLDPLGRDPDVEDWLRAPAPRRAATRELVVLALASPDPDDLTLRQARLLANADLVLHKADVPAAILDRARADATRRVAAAAPVEPAPGLTLFVAMAR